MTRPASGARIEVRGLTKRFGNFTAVDDLDFAVEPGRITGFLGPNGAGKTTTLRMLLGLVRPTVGHRDHRRPALPRHPEPAADGRARRSRPPTSTPAAAAATTCACSPPTAGDPAPPGRRAARAGRHPGRGAQARRWLLAWACASGSASRPRCSATRRCSSSTSPPTAWTRRASAGCAASCATSPPRADGPHLEPPAHRGRADRRRRRHHRQRPAACAQGPIAVAARRADRPVRTPDRDRAVQRAAPRRRWRHGRRRTRLRVRTEDLARIGDVALRAGRADPRAADPLRPTSRTLFFELTTAPENRNRNLEGRRRTGPAAPQPHGRGEALMIRPIKSEFLKFFTTRMWWGMAIAVFLAGAGFARLFGGHLHRGRRRRRPAAATITARPRPRRRPGLHRRASASPTC